MALLAGCGSSARAIVGEAGARDLAVHAEPADAEADGPSSDAGRVCPELVEERETGTLADSAIVEASGVVASRRNAGVYYVHNDSGDGARFFTITETGEKLAEFSLVGATNVDWEDVALGPGPAPGVDYLYFGDIGDNSADRAEITIYRVAEPEVSATQAPVSSTIEAVESFVFTYPDGARDAETLLVDPVFGHLYLVSKSSMSAARIYRADAPFVSGGTRTLSYVGSLGSGLDTLFVTGGDVSANGELVAVRTYTKVALWRRDTSKPLEASLLAAPCTLFENFVGIAEALAFDGDGHDLLTVPEGAGATLRRLGLR